MAVLKLISVVQKIIYYLSSEVKVTGRHFSRRLMDIGIVVVTNGNDLKSRVFMYELS